MFPQQALLLALQIGLTVAATSCNPGYYLTEAGECVQCSAAYALCFECEDEGIDLIVNGGFEEPDVPYGIALPYEEIEGWLQCILLILSTALSSEILIICHEFTAH